MLWLALSFFSAPRARADDSLRVVVRIASDSDRALVPRLRGQLSDLNAQLIVTETAPLEAALVKQLEVARTLAKLQGADAVVWCASEDAAQPRRVYIELAGSDRILSRALLGAASGALSSSDLETAAMLVRSALLALAQHVEIGVSAEAAADSGGDDSVEQMESSDAAGSNADSAMPAEADSTGRSKPLAQPPPTAATASRTPATHPELPATESAAHASMPAALEQEQVDHAEPPRVASEPSGLARAALQARLTLGAQLALDGRSNAGQRGLSARAGLTFGPWALDVYGVLSMASTIDDPYFALSVARHAVGVAVERVLPVSDTLQLGLALHGGALLLRRTSHAQNPAAVSMPPSLTAALALGPELAFRWLPSRFGLSLRFGMDILPATPRFEIAGLTPQRSAVSHSLWSFEPRMTLAWETALP